jgi:tetratricopeptide (TPR) repeat protein
MFRRIVLLVGGLASLSTVSLYAQDAVLGQQYGNGVHAYFSGDSKDAYDRLTAAIEGGSKDPRAFYFRGLAYLKLGRPEEAVADFRKGAELESKDVNRFYNVGKALERVQGQARQELETYRVNARMTALEETEKLRKARYEAIQREEERVLREQAIAAPEKPVDAGEAAKTADEAKNPFAPEAESPKDVDKPAATPEKAAPKKSTAAEKKSTPPAAKPAEKPIDGADPFDPAPEAEKPAAKKPAGKAPAPAEKKPGKSDKKDAEPDPFA